MGTVSGWRSFFSSQLCVCLHSSKISLFQCGNALPCQKCYFFFFLCMNFSAFFLVTRYLAMQTGDTWKKKILVGILNNLRVEHLLNHQEVFHINTVNLAEISCSWVRRNDQSLYLARCFTVRCSGLCYSKVCAYSTALIRVSHKALWPYFFETFQGYLYRYSLSSHKQLEMGDAWNPLHSDFVTASSQMFLTVMLCIPLCCSSGFDQTMPCLYCCVQDQKQGSTASHRASDQIMESV